MKDSLVSRVFEISVDYFLDLFVVAGFDVGDQVHVRHELGDYRRWNKAHNPPHERKVFEPVRIGHPGIEHITPLR